MFVSLAGDSLLSTEPVSGSSQLCGTVLLSRGSSTVLCNWQLKEGVLGGRLSSVWSLNPWFSSGWNLPGQSVSPAPPSLHPSAESAACPPSAGTDSVELSGRGPSVSSCSDGCVASRAVSVFRSSPDGVEACFTSTVLGEDGTVGVEPDGTGSGVAMSPLLGLNA